MKWLDKRIKSMIKRNSLDSVAECVKPGEVVHEHRHVVGSWTEIANEPMGPTALGVLMGLALLDHWWHTMDDVTGKTGVKFSMPVLSIEDDWLLMRGNVVTPPCVCINASRDVPPGPSLLVDGLKLVDRIPRVGDLIGRPYCILRWVRKPEEGGCYLVVPASEFADQFPGFLADEEESKER